MLLLVVGIPAAASPLFAPSRDLCFTDGPLTYRLSPSVSGPDYRVRIDNTAPQPDLRVRLVDSVELADLSLVDDIGPATCKTAGVFRTVAIVSGTADVTVSVSHEPQEADFALYVHSARVTHEDAAALFALMRHVAGARTVAQAH